MPPSVGRLCSNRKPYTLPDKCVNLIISISHLSILKTKPILRASAIEFSSRAVGLVSARPTDTLCHPGEIAETIDRNESCVLERGDVKHRADDSIDWRIAWRCDFLALTPADPGAAAADSRIR